MVCLHRLDPQRRKSSIIPRSLSEPVSCSVWRTFLSGIETAMAFTGLPIGVSDGLGKNRRIWRALFPGLSCQRRTIPERLWRLRWHRVRNQVEAAYTRSEQFARRCRLMDDWASYLAGDGRDAGVSIR